MTDEDGFLTKLVEDPQDDMTRLVYADWLEEHEGGLSAAKARFVRLVCDFRAIPTRTLRAALFARQSTGLSLNMFDG